MKLIYIMLLLLCVFAKFTQAQRPSLIENKVVYVVGNIVKPSEITFREGLTLKQAIKEAGGILPNSKSKIVLISRMIPETCKTQLVAKIKIKAIKKKQFEDLILQPYDIVEAISGKRIRGNVLSTTCGLNFTRIPAF